MLICKRCGRKTKSKEPTGRFVIYRIKEYKNGSIGKEAESELKTCFQCSGSFYKNNG